MEKHFLADTISGKSKFRAEPWYNPDGDCIVFKVADEAVVADRIDELLTIFNSAVDDRPIGFQIKGVQAIIRKYGLHGLMVESEDNAHMMKRVSITALLLEAYRDGPQTLSRRKAYATAMECPEDGRTILAEALQPA